jgi:hypothetical protein
MKAYVVESTMVAALGGLRFGLDTAVVSGTSGLPTETYQRSAPWNHERRAVNLSSRRRFLAELVPASGWAER